MKKSFSAITFTATRNFVTADRYVAHELYERNEAIINKLGGEILRGVGGFKAQFKTSAQAKKFVEQAITSINPKDYNNARKSEPKATTQVKAPKKPKSSAGKETYITLTDDNGNTYRVPMSALGINAPKSPVKQATAPKKMTKAPTMPKSKACKVDFSKLAGKGRAANSKASALINKAGYANNTPEYMTAWAEWCKVR